MSFLAALCGCWTRSNPSSPQEDHPPNQHHHTNTHHPVPSNNNTADEDPGNDGYNPIIPLPAYTPRPQSIHEKTLEAHLRDPPLSSTDTNTDAFPPYTDEKSVPYAYTPPSQRPEDLTSDVSSAISFPSSYGNTSTATRDTPPPPYSPRGWSPAPSRRSMSISSVVQRQLVMTQIAQPRPVFHRPDGRTRERAGSRRSLDEVVVGRRERDRRLSWESR